MTDTPPLPDVYQEDEPPARAVDVIVTNVVRVEEMPCRTIYRHHHFPTGSDAQQILGDDPRRKDFTIYAFGAGLGVEFVCIAETYAEAQDFQGALLWPNASVPLRFDVPSRGPLWARPCIFNETGGSFTGFGPSTDDAFLNLIINQWAS